MNRNGLVSILSVTALLVSLVVYSNSPSTGQRAEAGAAKSEPIYAQLSSMKTQQPSATGPMMAMMESNDALSGLVHNNMADSNKIIVKTPGVYFVVAACQVGREKDVSDDFVDVWIRQNGKDVDNSNTRQTIKDSKFTSVLVCQGIAECKANDVFEVAYSVSSAGKGLGIIATPVKGEPGIPSIIFSMYKIN